MRIQRISTLLAPLLATIASALVVIKLDPLIERLPAWGPEFAHVAHIVSATMLALCIAWLGIRMLDVFLWRAIVEWRTSKPAPALLVMIGRVLVFIAVGLIAYRAYSDKPIDAVLVSSGVVGIVLGFALQRMISDFFSGIALNFEHPLQEGHWIEIDGIAGRVVEINWRATRLETLDHVTVVVPNSFISERRFQNFNLPQGFFRAEVSVSLEYAVAAADAKRVLLAAVRAAPGVRVTPTPDVLLSSFGSDGMVYRCRFFIDDYSQINVVKDAVACSISQHLWQAGMSVPFPKRDVYLARMPQRDLSSEHDKGALLGRVELFQMLDDRQIQHLAEAARERRFAAGVDVVQQGESGDSLFVIVQGLLDVKLSSNGQTQQVGQLVPGQFFGEMSLLSGEPRSATVSTATETIVYEVNRHALTSLFQNYPQVAEMLSGALAERRMRIDAELRKGAEKGSQQQQRRLADDLLRRIRGLFGLGG